MNLSQAMRFKREIKNSHNIELNMLDTSEDGFVLIIERKALDVSAYKLLADYANQNQLILQLDSGNFILSSHTLGSQL